MKRIIVLAVMTIALAVHSEDWKGYTRIPIESKNLIDTNEKFNPTGKIIITDSFNRKTADTDKHTIEVEKLKTEKGNINGVAYDFYYSDGSGTFAGIKEKCDYSTNWTVSCKKDPFENFISGNMYFDKGNLSISIYKKGDISVPIITIGHSHFPGTTVLIKIDSLVYESDVKQLLFTPEQTREIIEKLKTAKKIVTRYHKWPYKANIDSEFELYGFNEAYTYLNWAVKQIK